MKTIKSLFLTALMAMTSLCGCASKTQNNAATAEDQPADSAQKRAIVCYFSATGTTAEAAKRIASLIEADLFEITPQQLYTDADLNWRDSESRSSVEMNDPSSRPAIANPQINAENYDIIFIGYPNWWNTHPTIINTFIEANNFSGKTIVPFMTSGGSDIVNSESQLRKQYPDLTFAKGLLMNGVSDDEIKSWLSNIK